MGKTILNQRRFSVWAIIALAGMAWLMNVHATRPFEKPATPPSTRAIRGDSVQSILRSVARRRPDMVMYIPETGRYCLINPRADAMPEPLMLSLQDAFYYDVNTICKHYAWKYLADWRTLMAKASRETFWGTSYLANRAHNYFGIRRQSKPWVCEAFQFCNTVVKDDPEPADFVIFADFESSLWMFIHTIYSSHYLARLPDGGQRVQEAIQYERTYGIHYWQPTYYSILYAYQLTGLNYSDEELISTWSEHPINNLCADCTRQSDRDWIQKVYVAELRARI